MGSWRFREYSPNSTADTATTGYYEDFYLPNVTSGRTANASYNIITTKNPGDLYWANVKVSASSNAGTAPTFSGIAVTKSGEPGISLTRTDYSPNHSAYMYVQAMGANKPSSLMFYVANAAGTRSSTFALDGEYGIILINKNYSGTLPSSGGRTGRLYFKTI